MITSIHASGKKKKKIHKKKPKKSKDVLRQVPNWQVQVLCCGSKLPLCSFVYGVPGECTSLPSFDFVSFLLYSFADVTQTPLKMATSVVKLPKYTQAQIQPDPLCGPQFFYRGSTPNERADVCFPSLKSTNRHPLFPWCNGLGRAWGRFRSWSVG